MDTSSTNSRIELARRANARPLVEQARGGFTLVELLMVLCVLVVLASLTLPSLLRWQRAMPMERAISILQLQLQETRLAAIRSGETWLLILPQNQTLGRRYPADDATVANSTLLFSLPTEIRCTDGSRELSASPIICHPDGTVADRRLQLIDANGDVTILQIDRLTGTASISPLQASYLQTAHRRPLDGVCSC